MEHREVPKAVFDRADLTLKQAHQRTPEASKREWGQLPSGLWLEYRDAARLTLVTRSELFIYPNEEAARSCREDGWLYWLLCTSTAPVRQRGSGSLSDVSRYGHVSIKLDQLPAHDLLTRMNDLAIVHELVLEVCEESGVTELDTRRPGRPGRGDASPSDAQRELDYRDSVDGSSPLFPRAA